MTPCLLVDMDVVQRNATKMLNTCKGLGVKLRCNMKTHKSREIGRIQTAGSRRCISVSTLKEAEYFADGGFDDILYTSMLTSDKIGRAMALLKKLNSFHVMLDNEAHLQVLEQHPLPDHQRWSAFLKVDTGGMRDVQQTIIGSCAQSEIAVRVATRVKGHCLKRNQLLIDAGFLAMSWDGFSAFDGALGGSFCRVDGHDNLKLVKMSQEVGHIEPRSGSLDFASHPIGSLLFLLPYHACATACQFTEFYGHSGDQITNVMIPCKGW
ncbi:hypothetical protein CAPTEDRAFT_228501 [Capitella teleta]|uniref:D-serine dehydratase-like domain-containing protein n=1 Tax=Capitella teleta TaxID=283909 RepID=R7TNP3_CAPTE|nr:hypothetical protein CAPTEDRAFT_228501 [Capitella teleta]|eukprot:ELT92685.1 hypothetical protein CAPTEDRAFT_228501 [Capitella teleta]